MLLEHLHDLRGGCEALADRDVDADDIGVLLIQDGVDGDGGLARLPVADDELALAAADGRHGIDRLQPRLEGLAHRLASDDSRGYPFDVPGLVGLDWPLAIDGLAQRIDDAAEHGLADRHLHDAAGALGHVTFFNRGFLAHQHAGHCVLFQIQGHAEHAVWELDELHGHGVFEAIDAGHTVAHLDDLADFREVELLRVGLNLAADNGADFFRLDVHKRFLG